MKYFKLGKNFHIVIDLIAAVLIWRGVWHLADRYFLPGNPVLSDLLGAIIGISILLIDDFWFGEIDRHSKHE